MIEKKIPSAEEFSAHVREFRKDEFKSEITHHKLDRCNLKWAPDLSKGIPDKGVPGFVLCRENLADQYIQEYEDTLQEKYDEEIVREKMKNLSIEK